MVQFFERVSLNSGETAAIVLTRYGIDSSRWPEVQRFQQNAHVPAGAGLNVGPPQVNFLCVPIDNFMMVVNYRVVSDTVNGLRPANLAWTAAERLAYVKACAHGVEIQIERDGNACVGLRWLQTAKKRNATPFHGRVSPPEFVDTGLTGFPFYNGHNDPNSADDLEFDDTPCGPAPSKLGMGLDFHATASLVAWTPPRVTIVEGYTVSRLPRPGRYGSSNLERRPMQNMPSRFAFSGRASGDYIKIPARVCNIANLRS